MTEVFVRRGDELKILREWGFLAALVQGVDPAEARVGDYARGEAVRVPADFDARAAVEPMEENDVLRLVVHDKEANADKVVAATDLAFAALSHIEKVGLRMVALSTDKRRAWPRAGRSSQACRDRRGQNRCSVYRAYTT